MPNSINVGARAGALTGARDDRHGTASGYFYYGCRCDKCRTASSDYQKKRREERNANLDAETHGVYATYQNAGCRCGLCREAYNAYRQARQRRTVSTKKIPKVKYGDLA